MDDIRSLVTAITYWKTYPPGQDRDERAFLELDATRLDELTEAWVPVHTAYGPGVLVFANSD